MTTVAVCVPTIPGREALRERALASVDAQTRAPDVVTVVEDVDADGAARTRNRTWQESAAEWIAFLDDDDELDPSHLELLLAHAERERADLVYPWFWIVDNAGRDMTGADPLKLWIGNRIISPFGLPFGAAHVEELRTRNNFIPITVLVRRALLEEVGGFPTLNSPEWPESCCEDWGLWRRLLDVDATFAHLPVRTWRWRWHGQNTSGRPWRQTRAGRRR